MRNPTDLPRCAFSIFPEPKLSYCVQVLQLATCYNGNMTLAEDMRNYVSRWKAIEAIQQEERRSASFELRWRQLNAAYGMAKGLDLLKPDPSEAGVFERWAKLKEKAAGKPRKVLPRS